jgi:hypothetical protein
VTRALASDLSDLSNEQLSGGAATVDGGAAVEGGVAAAVEGGATAAVEGGAAAVDGGVAAAVEGVSGGQPRFLGSTVPPPRGSRLPEVAEAADYGVMRGLFAPSVLLRLPLLYRYAEFLSSHGVRLGGEELDLSSHGVRKVVEGKLATAAIAEQGSVASTADESHALDLAGGGDVADLAGGGDVADLAGGGDVADLAGVGDVADLAGGNDVADRITTAVGEGAVDGMLEEATAAEAAAAEEEELLDELVRVRSEMGGEPALQQPALQLVLSVAARAGDAALAAAALKLGADASPRPANQLRGGSAVNEHGLPPLHMAARHGHTEMVRLLLDASASPTLLSTAGVLL